MFKSRSKKLERIDTGNYTFQEYETFLREIGFINRWLGDKHAIKAVLLKQITERKIKNFTVLDVGAGSGELLCTIAEFAVKSEKTGKFFGLDLNEISVKSISKKSKSFPNIFAVRGDAMLLPFAEKSFDYAFCSLFTHHFSDENIIKIIKEMKRISRCEIFVIDLHRHPLAYLLYKIFCSSFGISNLVHEDGLLSILRSFKPEELMDLAEKANLENAFVKRHFPFRLVLRGN